MVVVGILQVLFFIGILVIICIFVNDFVWVKKVLDFGFVGIMFFMINDVGVVRDVVGFCWYFFVGVRGVVFFIV